VFFATHLDPAAFSLETGPVLAGEKKREKEKEKVSGKRKEKEKVSGTVKTVCLYGS